VSFDIYLQPFRDGGSGTGDGEAAMKLLAPLVARRENNWARIATADGEADVYGIDNAATGLMVNHVGGSEVYGLLYDLARSARFIVMPVGCPTCIADPAMREHLPESIAVDAVLVESGDHLRRIIENG
jgi:hypothetical protein